MRDDNVRRLLHYSARERRTAFAAVTNGPRIDDMTRRHYAIIARADDNTDHIIETGLLNLGVRTLWLDGYDELPERLAYVYEGCGDSWDAVYGRQT